MMYENKMAVAILANGRVLREVKDTVYMPFGQDYVIRFKNMNSLRAMVRVSVDGQDATEGTSLIVPANGTVDLERFLKADNLEQGHKFKFIERTAKIEDGPRGIKVEDGLIRVEFEFEKQHAKIEDVYLRKTYIYDTWHGSPTRTWHPTFGDVWCSTGAVAKGAIATGADGVQLSNTAAGSFADVQSTSALRSFGGAGGSAASMSTLSSNAVQQDTASAKVEFMNASNSTGVNQSFVPDQALAGITVPGAISEQKFKTGAWFAVDGQKHVMVLRLMGTYGDAPVEEPVTVKTKIECPTCGTKSQPGVKFCGECGTSLVTL
jgi:hypothetical protein